MIVATIRITKDPLDNPRKKKTTKRKSGKCKLCNGITRHLFHRSGDQRAYIGKLYCLSCKDISEAKF